MIMKYGQKATHIEDLRETFKTLQNYRLRLNLAKCSFGVASEKFLGQMISI